MWLVHVYVHVCANAVLAVRCNLLEAKDTYMYALYAVILYVTSTVSTLHTCIYMYMSVA